MLAGERIAQCWARGSSRCWRTPIAEAALRKIAGHSPRARFVVRTRFALAADDLEEVRIGAIDR